MQRTLAKRNRLLQGLMKVVPVMAKELRPSEAMAAIAQPLSYWRTGPLDRNKEQPGNGKYFRINYLPFSNFTHSRRNRLGHSGSLFGHQ